MTTRHRRTDAEDPSDDLSASCDVAHYIAALKATVGADDDPLEAAREAASWNLIRACDAAAVEPLLAIVADHTESVAFRSTAITILGRLEDSRAVGLLCSILADPNEALAVRRDSLWALEAFSDAPQALEALGNVLLDPDEDVQLRTFAAWALRDTRNPLVAAPLLVAAHDQLPDIRTAVADALSDVGDESVIPTLLTLCRDTVPEVRAEAAEAFRGLAWRNYKAISAVEPLLNMLMDETERTIVRRGAASALGFIRDARAVEPLISLLSYKGRKFRNDIIDALAELRDVRAVEPLLSMLADNAEDEYLVTHVIRALGRIGDARAADPLVAFFQREGLGFDLGRATLKGLRELGDLRTAALMIPLLKSDDQWIRHCIAGDLGEVGDYLAVEPLIEAMLHDPAAEVRAAAAESLTCLPDSRAAQPLMLALKDEDHTVRGHAAEALGALREDWVFDVLAGILLDKIEDGYTRSGAAKGLCYLGGERVVALLLQVVDEEDDFLLYGVAEALGELGDRSILPALRKLHQRMKWHWIAERITDSIASIESKNPDESAS